MIKIKLLVLLTFFAFTGYAQSVTDSLLRKNIMSIPFSEQKGGELSLLAVINLHFEESEWFLFQDYNSRKIKHPPGSFLTISEINKSPKQSYLAIISVGEGHPVLEVVSFSELIDEKRTQELKNLIELDPYPGYIQIAGWKNDATLIVESDRLLTEKKENRFPGGLENGQKFLVNIKTGEIKKYK